MTLEKCVPIKTKRLMIRPIQDKDAEGIYSIRHDLDMIKYSGIKQMMTIEEAKTFVSTRIEGIVNDKWFYWIIADPHTDCLMGTICLFNFNQTDASCDIGYELLPQYQGHGYIAEAMNEIMAYAFKALKIELLFADIHEDNKASIRVIKRAGFTQFKELDNGYVLYRAKAIHA